MKALTLIFLLSVYQLQINFVNGIFFNKQDEQKF